EAEEQLRRHATPGMSGVSARGEGEGAERITHAQQPNQAVVAEVTEACLRLEAGEDAVADPEGPGSEGVLRTCLDGKDLPGLDGGERVEIVPRTEEEAPRVDAHRVVSLVAQRSAATPAAPPGHRPDHPADRVIIVPGVGAPEGGRQGVEPVPGECRPEGLDVARRAEGGGLVSPVGSFRGNGGDRGAAADAQLTASGALGEGPAAGPVELPPVPGGVRRNQPGTDPYEWALHPVVAEEVVS